MKNLLQTNEKGQAIVMVALALVAMCGILGLAVDLGWSFFVRRTGQTFADVGALGAVNEAFSRSGRAATSYCVPNSVLCNTPSNYPCPSTESVSTATPPTTPNLANGCVYTRGESANGGYAGFVDGSNSSRTQTANIESGSGPLTLSDGSQINTFYWARVRVSETVPQLFSAVLGNRFALVGATGTAAIVGLPIEDSLILTNRQFETAPVGQGGGWTQGKNLFVGGSGNVSVPRGIRLASNMALSGEIQSGGTVTAAHTWTMASDGTANWTYTKKADTGTFFHDPFEGLGNGGGNAQPPVTTTAQPDCPVPGGIINGGTPANPLILAPGNYYATNNSGNPTWAPVQVKNNTYVKFAALPSATNSSVFTYTGKATTPCKVGASSYTSGTSGNYFIYGGLVGPGGSNGGILIEPGRYVLAGAHQSGPASSVNDVLTMTSNATMVDNNASANPPASPSTNPGEIFIMTRPGLPGSGGHTGYAGLETQIQSIPNLNNANPGANLDYGSVSIQGGSQTQSIQLHGLTPGLDSTDPLKPFEEVLFWQDQGNSRVAYDSNGNIITTQPIGCGQAGPGNSSYTNPCTNSSLQHQKSPQFNYGGSSTSVVYGIFYQPRGAWMLLQGGGSSASNNKTMIITGALQTGGSAGISFGPLSNPPIQRVVALVD